MFGYVRIYKPDITFAQYDMYKGVYCSLCKQIGKRYGLLSRLTLSYDFTFFALLRLAVSDKCAEFHKSRCSFNPLKPCLGCDKDNKEMKLAADISILTVYYKYIDNLSDTKGINRFLLKILFPFFKRIRKKALKNCPEADAILSEMTLKQQTVEKAGAGLDEAAHPSADALGRLLSIGTEREDLYRFGYMTGRWVYIADAADDYDDDKKSGGFNPFMKLSREEAMEKAYSALNLTLSELTESFESIKMNCLRPVLGNIIYEGMYRHIRKITGKEGNSNGKSV